MSDGIGELVRALDEAINLLASVGETHWTEWLDCDRRRIVVRDAYGLEHLLQAFGGMGSFNDVLLHHVNGHVGDEATLRAANDRLEGLRSEIFESATDLLREHRAR